MSSETGYNPGTETCHTLYDRGGKRASGDNATWRLLFILLYGRERAGHFVEEWTVADCGRILLEDALHLIYASRREKGKGCFYYTHIISDVKSIITLTCGAMEQQLGSEDCMRGSLGPHAKSRVGSTSYAHGSCRSGGSCTTSSVQKSIVAQSQSWYSKSVSLLSLLSVHNVHWPFSTSTAQTPAPNFCPEQHESSFFSPNASLLNLSTSPLPCLMPLGTLQ